MHVISYTIIKCICDPHGKSWRQSAIFNYHHVKTFYGLVLWRHISLINLRVHDLHQPSICILDGYHDWLVPCAQAKQILSTSIISLFLNQWAIVYILMKYNHYLCPNGVILQGWWNILTLQDCLNPNSGATTPNINFLTTLLKWDKWVYICLYTFEYPCMHIYLTAMILSLPFIFSLTVLIVIF